MQVENWEPTITELRNSISLIQDYFGKEWIDEQRKILKNKPKQFANKFTHHLKPEPHSIVSLYVDSLRNYAQIESNPENGFDIAALRLISFCQSLARLQRIGVVDFSGKKLTMNSQDRFRERLRNKDEFDQTAYEIQIAVALARKGLSTWFIQESSKANEKTPDILVVYKKQRFYVECKYQGLTNREKQYENSFKEFYWRSMHLMFQIGEFYSICVEWIKDPVLEDVITTVELLKEKIREKQAGIIETETAKIWLDHMASRGQIFDGPFTYDIGKYKSDSQHIDIVMPQAHVGIFDGVPKHRNPTLIMFRNIAYLDDLVNGAIQDINKAYSQIPEKGPSAIFLENRVSFLDEFIKESAKDLQERIERKLGLISRINRVILTKSYFDKKRVEVHNRVGIAIMRFVESRIIPNPKPATPLLQDIIDRITSLRYY
jgi:hypothetical protein